MTVNRWSYIATNDPINKYGTWKPGKKLARKSHVKATEWGEVDLQTVNSYPYYFANRHIEGLGGIRIDARQYKIDGYEIIELGLVTGMFLDDLEKDFE